MSTVVRIHISPRQYSPFTTSTPLSQHPPSAQSPSKHRLKSYTITTMAHTIQPARKPHGSTTPQPLFQIVAGKRRPDRKHIVKPIRLHRHKSAIRKLPLKSSKLASPDPVASQQLTRETAREHLRQIPFLFHVVLFLLFIFLFMSFGSRLRPLKHRGSRPVRSSRSLKVRRWDAVFGGVLA